MAQGRMINKRIGKSKKFNLGLKNDKARLAYLMIYPHVDVEGRIEADIDDLKIDCFPYLKSMTPAKISKALTELTDVGLIISYEIDKQSYLQFLDFEKNQPNLRKDREADSKIPPPPLDAIKINSGPLPEDSGPAPATSPLNLNLKFNLKSKFKFKYNGALRASVIAYLNERTGKKFNPESKATAHLINARLEEGRTLEDFKRVIDIKVGKWKGDPKMDDYLRPETLFNRTKMEAYLNEKPSGELTGVKPNEPEWLKKGWAAHEKRKRAEEEKESKP